jgi:uncharacterized membrane protein YphA (DoxX/SURF4 family)
MIPTIAEWFLRVSLSSAFLSAVADRFGVWGPSGTPNVFWGNWHNFLFYSAKLNAFLPQALQPVLAWLATILELGLGVGLLLPVATRWTALASGLLLMLFAISMTVALGIKAPLNFSVFTAAAGAFLLAALKSAPGSKTPRR